MVESDVRPYSMTRFTKGIFQTVGNDAIVIPAMDHCHHDPNNWQKRLQDDPCNGMRGKISVSELMADPSHQTSYPVRRRSRFQ